MRVKFAYNILNIHDLEHFLTSLKVLVLLKDLYTKPTKQTPRYLSKEKPELTVAPDQVAGDVNGLVLLDQANEAACRGRVRETDAGHVQYQMRELKQEGGVRSKEEIRGSDTFVFFSRYDHKA